MNRSQLRGPALPGTRTGNTWDVHLKNVHFHYYANNNHLLFIIIGIIFLGVHYLPIIEIVTIIMVHSLALAPNNAIWGPLCQ